MSFDKTAIEEANKHLLAMNKRVIELGAMLNDKTVRLENIESENQVKIEAIIRQKDAEIEKRNAWLDSTQAEIRRLKAEMMQKDSEINQLRLKAAILDKVSRYKPDLVGLLNCLNELDVGAPTAAPVARSKSIDSSSSADISRAYSTASDEHKEGLFNGKPTIPSDNEDIPQPEPEATKPQNIIWTPKDRSVQQGDNRQSAVGTNQKSRFPSKTPGGAVKDIAPSPDSRQHDQTNDPDSDHPEASVKNYETQL